MNEFLIYDFEGLSRIETICQTFRKKLYFQIGWQKRCDLPPKTAAQPLKEAEMFANMVIDNMVIDNMVMDNMVVDYMVVDNMVVDFLSLFVQKSYLEWILPYSWGLLSTEQWRQKSTYQFC